MFLAAAALLVAGVPNLVDGIRTSSTESQTQGVVQEFQKSCSAGGCNRWATVAYSASGTQYEIEMDAAEDLFSGDTVTVYYDPNNPQSAVLSKSKTLGLGVGATLLGSLLVLMGVAFAVWAIRGEPEPQEPKETRT